MFEPEGKIEEFFLGVGGEIIKIIGKGFIELVEKIVD